MSIGLVTSIIIRLLALTWSLALWRRIRDWRMAFLSVMLALMALRQILTLESKFTSFTPSFSGLATEWPGLIVSVMAFLSVFFLGNMLKDGKRIEAEQKALIRELEDKNAELERFTYTISHDLKTPLVTIKGFIGFLGNDLDRGDGDAVRRDLDKIDSAAEKMSQSLDELLELSKIGRVVNPFESVSMGEIIDTARSRLEAQIAASGAELVVQPDLPNLFVDRSRLVEVMVILLDNAIKYRNPLRPAVIEIECRELADEVFCQVSDNGIGIDAEFHEHVFGLFERLDANTEGSGVGLTMAKRIIEHHRGRMWIASNDGECGAKVSFAIPRMSQ